MPREAMPTLQAHDLRRVYGRGDSRVEALRGVSLEVAAGEFLAVVGPSGCGKTTLLHLCGGMDRPTAGTVAVDGLALGDLDDEALTGLRRERVGFVFQFFNLLPTLTLAENIALPLLLAGVAPAEGATRAREGAERVGLGHRLAHFPAQVSGGELQRAAVARAVIHAPALLIADEPTGNLDTESGQRVLEVLRTVHRETGVAVLLATHDPLIAGTADRVLRMRDGVEVPAVLGDSPASHREPS
ncbi:MAG: ABC transporter ATP-binding protein [Acidobacteria bacterium]|nr:ABC transporter ATP-binding protein [Acidobacteriota bacterium]